MSLELSRYLGDLKGKHDEARLAAARDLRRLVESTIRSRPTDSAVFVDELNRLVLDLVNSTNTTDKLGGIAVIGLSLLEIIRVTHMVPFNNNSQITLWMCHMRRMTRKSLDSSTIFA